MRGSPTVQVKFMDKYILQQSPIPIIKRHLHTIEACIIHATKIVYILPMLTTKFHQALWVTTLSLCSDTSSTRHSLGKKNQRTTNVKRCSRFIPD